MKLLLAAGIASLTAALDRGDLDEAARQGALAGPATVARALEAPARGTLLAGIVAAPAVEDAPELVPALTRVAAGPDRRTAIPAARAAREIARELARREIADDLAADELATWSRDLAALAADPARFVEVRTAALDAAAALAHVADPSALGFELPSMLADRDPAVRTAALTLIPQPAPAALRPALAAAVVGDRDPAVALAAAQALCADLVVDPPGPVLAALGPDGLARIRTLAQGKDPASRDARRCLSARR